jgi:hypothetical protein
MTFSMSRGTAARLKEIAIAENTSMQQLIAEALDEWLARRVIGGEGLSPAKG